MKNEFPNGVWPVMLTPYTEDNKIDYPALEKLTEWYFENDCDGLFAVCQSSEMFQLTLEERCKIAAAVKKYANGKPVIASGHISDSMEDQAEELKRMADTGIDALILISNRPAAQQESDQVMIERLQTLMEQLPKDLPLGFYECPYPYKRVLSREVVKFLVDSERFYFLKDTSCDMASMSEKLQLIQGSNLKLYNANTATLLESLQEGAAGYSGVMANFHPRLYSWLCKNYAAQPEKARKVTRSADHVLPDREQQLSRERQICITRRWSAMTLHSRRLDWKKLTVAQRMEAEQLIRLSAEVEIELGIAR